MRIRHYGVVLLITASCLIGSLAAWGWTQNEMEPDRMPRCAATVLPPTWNLTRGGAYYDYANGMVLDSDNNVYLANEVNFTWGQGKTDAEIVKYSRCGELMWNRSLGGVLDDAAYDVAIDAQGYVYLAGATQSWGAGDYDALLAKYDTNGNLQWNITWGDASYQWATSIAVDNGGNIYLAGWFGSSRTFVAKFSPTHALLWSFIWNSKSLTDNFEDIAVDASGNVYIAGWNYTFLGGLNWDDDAFLAKFNSAGHSEWNRTYKTLSKERGNGVTVDISGDIYFTGWSNLTGNYDVFVQKYEPTGGVIWEQTFLGAKTDYGVSIAVDAKKNSYICGNTMSSGAGGSDVFLLALNVNGTKLWNWTWGGPGPELGSDIVVGTDGFLYLCGSTYSWTLGEYPNALLLKIHSSGEAVAETPCWLWVVIVIVSAGAAVVVVFVGWRIIQKRRSSKK